MEVDGDWDWRLELYLMLYWDGELMIAVDFYVLQVNCIFWEFLDNKAAMAAIMVKFGSSRAEFS